MQFITLVNRSYLPGLAVLCESLLQNSGVASRITLTIVHDESCTSRELDRFRAFDMPLKIHGLDHFQGPRHRTREKASNLDFAFKKLGILNVPLEEKAIYIDCDMLCLRPLGELETFKHFSAARETHAEQILTPEGDPMFNTGLFVFAPSREFYEQVESFYRNSERKFYLGDQGVLNSFFYELNRSKLNLLPAEWNWLIAGADLRSKSKHYNPPRLVHYVGVKPWQKPLTEIFSGPSADLDILWWESYYASCKRIRLDLRSVSYATFKARTLAHRVAKKARYIKRTITKGS